MASSSSGTLGAGAEFGPYTILRQVGRGAFGIVYEALRNPLKRRVALKILHEHVLSSPDASTRFQREIMTAAQVEHPHVVGVFDGGVKDERGYLAMEYLEGETLAERLKRDKFLRVEEAMDILLPIASALDAVHNAGVVHRDIKPGNIFLTRHITGITYPKLVDFGIAKLVSDDFDLTQTHSWLGTPFYMSPEQVRQSKSIDARADQWSLGVVLYEALTGEKPFRSEVLLDLLESITTRDATVPSKLQTTIPAGLDAVINRMMERDPVKRFPSMRAVGSALWPFASPRTRALWARHFDREGDPGARIEDVIEARDSGFLTTSAGNDKTTVHPDKTTVHDGEKTTIHDSDKTTIATKREPAASPTPSSIAWPQVGAGLLAGALVMLGFQQLRTPPAAPPTEQPAEHPAVVTPPPLPDVAMTAPVAAPMPDAPPTPAVVPPRDAAPTLAAADVPVAPTTPPTNGATTAPPAHAAAPTTAPTPRGAPYCDDDPSVRDACAALQSGDRSAAIRAFQELRSPRALVALAHLYRQSGRFVDAEEKLERALSEGGDAWVMNHTSFTNGLLAEVQSRLGSITITCQRGEVAVGPDGAARRYTLPHAAPVRSPAGHVQVVITNEGVSFQQYVDVRAGQTAQVISCGAGG